jgi:Family of unknown function (DUF6062)
MAKTDTSGELGFALSVFRKGLEDGGCLVCRALADAEERSLHSFLYEGMTTAPVLLAFLARGGFCPHHFRMAMHLGVNRWSVGCVELAILCRHILPLAANEAAGIHAQRGRRRLFARRRAPEKSTLFPGRDCIFCQEWKEREGRFVGLLELVAEREEFSAALASGDTCLPHGAMALAGWESNLRAERLWKVLQSSSDRLAAGLKSFLEKFDDRHRHEPFGTEINALDRAVDFLSALEPNRRAALAHGQPKPGDAARRRA